MGAGSNFTPLCWFSLNNSETLKAVPWPFAAFSNISLETSLPNLVSLTCPSLQILGNTDGGISDFWISGQSLVKVSCHNSRTSDDIDMKHMQVGPVTKLDQRKKTTSKKFDDDIM